MAKPDYERTRKGILERDGYRCKECGVSVNKDKGLTAHLHHLVPKSAGGGDEVENRITLCQPCHCTKYQHEFMLSERPLRAYPEFVKWALRETAIDLLFYAESLDPKKFPRTEVINHIDICIATLKKHRQVASDCLGDAPGTNWDTKKPNEAELEALIEGLHRAYWSHEYQRGLDQILRRYPPRRRRSC